MRGKGLNYKGFTLISLLLLRKRSCKGFTLIELLVTISILAILMTIAMISYGEVQKNMRDNKRKADLATIQSALEQYHADQGYYPQTSDVPFTADSSLINGTRTYLQVIPLEGRPVPPYSQYVYVAKPDSPCTTNCTNYCLYATVENPSNSAIATQCSGAPPSTYQVQAP